VARIAKLTAAALGAVLYAWFAGVRRAPAAKRRKAARREQA
jgi:hypothetical protein